MRAGIILIVLVLVLALALLGVGSTKAGPPEEARAIAVMKNASGQNVGVATFAQTSEGVRIHLEGSGLPAGPHGTHIHAIANCAPPGFTSAGGHFNPLGKKHGLANPDGPHAGDLPNLLVGSDGKGMLDYTNSLVTLVTGPTSLYDADGSALVIHAAEDDLKTDPTGNSGGRVACGPIRPAYSELDSASAAHQGDALILSLQASWFIPRFPDAYVNSVPVYGYAWADLDTGKAVIVAIHPPIGRDSHQNPDGWHTHPVRVATGTPDSDFCVADVGTSQGGIAVRGGNLLVVVPAHDAGVAAEDLDVAASFEVRPDLGCASGLGVLVHFAAEL